MSESSGNGREQRRRGLPLEAASRITGLVTSVMDLHVRIALKEVDREKRRLIIGLVLLGGGLAALLTALLAGEIALLCWLVLVKSWSWMAALGAFAVVNLVLSGVMLRIGGQLTKGPYLPETMAGLTKTTRALVGR
ncbi:phage holin family protein [Synechococcus sp. CB0101]|uniref:phage holin family protein n=1 Tax=Synechococcus sp. CB0101 TaxID=232348 RepID=UPI00020023FD|nr:phage holin family protein [Synechococcus sp. CB0101]QCH15876.1 phage holin family protein [Synechococcus sp. CB0101]